MLQSLLRIVVCGVALTALCPAEAGGVFSGTWSVDLRTPEQRARGVECGEASFVLKQDGDEISGEHSMATVGCGRLNEGGSVSGVVVGNTAVLTVTSSRNGAIVLGTAKLAKGTLQWRLRELVHSGNPENDTPLILDRGTLRKVR